MRKTILAVSLAVSVCGITQATEWGYKDDVGPEHWGEFAKACAEGKNQSPIDISDTVEAELQSLDIHYNGMVTGLTNNGHTLQAVVSGDNVFSIDGIEFNLAQFHFHTPSENHIKGQSYPLEAHFVNADKSGNLAVLSVMYAVDKSENSQIGKLIDSMPQTHQTVQLKQAFPVKDMLPKMAKYYRFNGSLTTPPCSEGVRWIVAQSQQSLTSEQVQKMQAVMGENNRPLQDHNARVVLSDD
ncbi:carbonic anhydrase [Vibrio zhanjiangensis]|uniref:carbonic anhydrase n=1 Tax=Vibrio zhanjiangensis TaxID=1046128 RepID=UPI0024E13325|nr:carbonic anhydrase family protein [Vibrio zhanjiangensis]